MMSATSPRRPWTTRLRFGRLGRPICLISTLLVSRLLETAAHADEAVAVSASDATGPRRPLPRWSLTFSPIYLAIPMGVVAGEARVRDKLSVAVIAGAGLLTQESPGIKTHLRILRASAQSRYYLVGDFRHGMQVGAEAMYLHVGSPFAKQILVAADGFAIGPFVGYKIATTVGFTFDTQIGYQYLWAWGSSNGFVSRVDTSILLLNVNVGWSF